MIKTTKRVIRFLNSFEDPIPVKFDYQNATLSHQLSHLFFSSIQCIWFLKILALIHEKYDCLIPIVIWSFEWVDSWKLDIFVKERMSTIYSFQWAEVPKAEIYMTSFDIEKFEMKYAVISIEVFCLFVNNMIDIGQNLSNRSFKAFTYKCSLLRFLHQNLNLSL